MKVYSSKIVSYIREIRVAIKEVLTGEVGLRVRGDRFFDRAEQHSYPIDVVVFNNKAVLGYFDPEFYELGFHQQLMFVNRGQLLNVIRHELAHYIAFIDYGILKTPHSEEFRNLCKKMGWGPEVYSRSCSLDNEHPQAEEENVILRKIQKLMALATSGNCYEAEQAMIKAQQMLLKHNIDSRYLGEDGEVMVLSRVMKQKKAGAMMSAIAQILKTFFVTTVYNRGTTYTHLEIAGTKVNVEIAEYVAEFLQTELEKLWQQMRQKMRLKGIIARNSFLLGVAKGYCDKVSALKQSYSAEEARALMILEKQLVGAKEMIYPRLSESRSSRAYCHESEALGKMAGRNLTIHPAIRDANRSSAVLLLR